MILYTETFTIFFEVTNESCLSKLSNQGHDNSGSLNLSHIFATSLKQLLRLTHVNSMFLSCRTRSMDLHCKSVDRFQHDGKNNILPLFFFYTLLKHQKTSDFLMFQGMQKRTVGMKQIKWFFHTCFGGRSNHQLRFWDVQ